MSPRKYELQARAESAAQTRERIVAATMDLHIRKGISRTTLRDIANAADVSPGTVLRHFPQMEELVVACGTLTQRLLPFPGPEVAARIDDPRVRLRATVRAVFGYWDAAPQAWPMIEGERAHWAPVDQHVRDREAARRALLDAVLPPGRGRRRTRLLATALALTTWNSRAALRDEGLDLDAATEAVVDLLLPAGAGAPAR
ncbi:MAG TPA: helix-turn-helix domain-containing protein [Frankiaceae bacterium]|nr:helix-turn-helix domain-containing protein [Frankiaceae bacterium]